MKRMFGAMMIAGLLAAPLAVRAHEGFNEPEAGEAHHGMAGMMKEKLGLSAVQVQQLKKLHEDAAKAMKPLHDKAQASRRRLQGLRLLNKPDDEIIPALAEARKDQEALMSAMKDMKARMDAILTPSQQADMFLMHEGMHRPMMRDAWRGMHGRGPGHRQDRPDHAENMPASNEGGGPGTPPAPPAGDDGSDD